MQKAHAHDNNRSDRKDDSTIMAVGVLGAVVGGAIGSALAVALSDKDTRKRVFDAVDTIRSYAQRMQEQYPELKAKTRRAVDEGEKVVDKLLLEKGKGKQPE